MKKMLQATFKFIIWNSDWKKKNIILKTIGYFSIWSEFKINL